MSKVYSPLKIFHHKEKLDSLNPFSETILAPIHVRIKPTNTCNQHCYFCAYGQNDLSLGGDMIFKEKIPREKMLGLVDELENIGVKAITFSGGGEPFIYPYIEEVLERIRLNGKMKVAFITNGISLDGRKLEIVADYASWVRISVDGWDDESYSKYRKVPVGKWSKLQGNIEELLAKRNKCKVGIYMIIDKDNKDHVYSMLKHYKQLGVDSIKVYGVLISDDVDVNTEYHKKIEAIVKPQIEKAKLEFEDDVFQLYDGYSSQVNHFNKQYDWCPSIQMRPVIGADLFLYSCQDKAYTESGKIGDLNNNSFSDIWFSGKDRFHRIKPSKDCIHHCAVNKQNEAVTEYYDLYEDHNEFL